MDKQVRKKYYINRKKEREKSMCGNTEQLISRETSRMLRNIRMAFHFLDKDMVRNVITTIRPKL